MKTSMNVFAIILIVLFCLMTTGCSPSWIPDRRPETAEERQAVAEHEKMLLSKIPSTLSGHDQDWDDVVSTVHKIAVQTHCKTRLYEYYMDRYTGKVKELSN